MIPFGQPILVGHHSEKGHRRDLDKADRLMRKSIEEREIADNYAQRAARAGMGENPSTIKNRIKKLEADERMFKRKIDPYSDLNESDKDHYRAWLKKTQDRLEVERKNYQQSGGIPADSLNIKKGQRIMTHHGPATVTKVNRDTIRVDFDAKNLSGFHMINKNQVDAILTD